MRRNLILMTISFIFLFLSIFSTEKIKVGSEENYYPFSYMTNSQISKGLNFELTKAIAKVSDLDVEFVYKPFAELRTMLENGEIDAIAGMYFSEERQKAFDFSQNYFIIHHAIFKSSGMKDIQTIEDLKDMKIVLMESDITHDYIIENNLTEKITTVRSEKEALMLLSDNFIGYSILAEYPALYWIDELGIENVEMTGEKILPFKYCYAVKKGNSDLLFKLSEGLSVIKDNGAYDDIYEDWMGKYIPDETVIITKRRYLLTGLSIALILLIIIAFIVFFFRKEVRKRTRELRGEIRVRESAESKLAEQNEHLSSILKNATHYGIYRTKTDKNYSKTDVVFCSPSLTDIIGIDEKDLYNFEKWFDYIYPEDLPKVIESNQRGYFPPFRFNEIFRVVNPEKGVRWCSISSNGITFKDDPTKIEYANGIIMDITEQKHAEFALLESREHFKALFDNSMNAILISDDNGNYTSVNPAAVELFGYSEEEFNKMNVKDIQDASLYTPYKNYEEHLKKGKTFGELFFLDKFGNKKIAEYHKVRIMKNFNVSIMTEITERIKSEMGLKEALEQAEKANRAKSEFLANMSHEIRTPMNGIIGFSEILMNSEISSHEKKYIEYILTSARNLLYIINDILDFSKIESGAVHIMEVRTDVRELIHDTVTLLKASNKNEKVKLNERIDQKIPNYLIADSVKLNQIITNLISNALKFTEAGEVNLILTLIEDIDDTCQIKFEITDTGIGIEESKKKEILKAFTQADSTITRKYGGTGLGLSITNSLIKLMGGQLDIFSEVGNGSAFSFILGFKKSLEDDAAIDQERKLQINDLNIFERDIVILIAEDNMINRALAKTVISNHFPNSRILEAEDGEKCVQLYKNNNPDIILMDLHMPNLDGIKATRMIRIVEGDKSRVPIIGLTADIKSEKRQLALDNGMDDLLTKPLERDKLKSVLVALLNR
jgi:PAS domain S-box-containing protein